VGQGGQMCIYMRCTPTDVYIYMYTYIHIYIYACICMYIYICMYIHVNNSCMAIYKSNVDIMSILNTDVAKWYKKYNVAVSVYKKYDVALCSNRCACIYISIHVYIYIYIHACVHAYVYLYMHTCKQLMHGNIQKQCGYHVDIQYRCSEVVQ
jgi:hypothetical protein